MRASSVQYALSLRVAGAQTSLGCDQCGEDFGLESAQADLLAERGAPDDAFKCAMVEARLDWNAPGGSGFACAGDDGYRVRCFVSGRDVPVRE